MTAARTRSPSLQMPGSLQLPWTRACLTDLVTEVSSATMRASLPRRPLRRRHIRSGPTPRAFSGCSPTVPCKRRPLHFLESAESLGSRREVREGTRASRSPTDLGLSEVCVIELDVDHMLDGAFR